MAGKKVQYAGGLRIGTRCETVDEFIEKFYRFCDGSQLFIPHAKRQTGVDTAFSFDLKDGRAALAGLGVVLDTFADADNRYGRPGIVIEVTQLASSCRSVLEQMSTLRRTKRASVSAESTATPTPTPTPTPVSVRTLSAVPGHRPRAVTAAIEIDSAIAIAKENAAARARGPIDVPKAIRMISPAAENVAPAAFADASSPLPAERIAQAAPAPAARKPVRLPGVAEPAPAAAQPAPAAAGPVRAFGVVQPTQQPANLPTSSEPPPLASGIVEQVNWDASKAFDVPSGPVRTYGEHFGFAPPAPAAAPSVEPPGRVQRWLATAKRIARNVQVRAHQHARTGMQKWRALTPKRRRIVAAGAGGGALLLVVLVIVAASGSPAPVPPLPAAFLAAATPPPVVEEPKPVVEPTKKPTKATKKRTKKKSAAKKPVAKPTTKRSRK